MSAVRYSGDVTVRVTYLDRRHGSPNGHYWCVVSAHGLSHAFSIQPPVVLSHPVDSSEMFDDVARSAIAFAEHDGVDVQKAAWTEHGVHVGRSKARAWS